MNNSFEKDHKSLINQLGTLRQIKPRREFVESLINLSNQKTSGSSIEKKLIGQLMFTKFAILSLIFAILLGGTTVVAAQKAERGSALYPVKNVLVKFKVLPGDKQKGQNSEIPAQERNNNASQDEAASSGKPNQENPNVKNSDSVSNQLGNISPTIVVSPPASENNSSSGDNSLGVSVNDNNLNINLNLGSDTKPSATVTPTPPESQGSSVNLEINLPLPIVTDETQGAVGIKLKLPL